jgi:hypothetical protein
LNNSLNTAYEEDFEIALKMRENEYSYNELISFLGSEKIVEKQIAILSLNELKSKEDALNLVSNLIGQDGKIREAVAFKLNELSKYKHHWPFFDDKRIFNLLLKGIMDINGNVCRNILNVKWIEEETFGLYLSEKLPQRINNILEEIENNDTESKQYVISKRNFQLYWSLEALYKITDYIDVRKLKNTLFKTARFDDYTIREKTAKILSKIDYREFEILKEQLKNDENYYVKSYFS